MPKMKALPKTVVWGNTIEVPIHLAKLLASEPEEFKTRQEYEEVQTQAKALMKLLTDGDAIVWGT